MNKTKCFFFNLFNSKF